MTPSELAKVRELVEAQRAFRNLTDTEQVFRDHAAVTAYLTKCDEARDHVDRAFLAVEAMVAEHQTEDPQS